MLQRSGKMSSNPTLEELLLQHGIFLNATAEDIYEEPREPPWAMMSKRKDSVDVLAFLERDLERDLSRSRRTLTGRLVRILSVFILLAIVGIASSRKRDTRYSSEDKGSLFRELYIKSGGHLDPEEPNLILNEETDRHLQQVIASLAQGDHDDEENTNGEDSPFFSHPELGRRRDTSVGKNLKTLITHDGN
jgi:hypothetical protein